MPLVSEIVRTFDDLAYLLSDQSDYIQERLMEYKDQYDGHYMTQMNKKLVKENKDLLAQIHLKELKEKTLEEELAQLKGESDSMRKQ